MKRKNLLIIISAFFGLLSIITNSDAKSVLVSSPHYYYDGVGVHDPNPGSGSDWESFTSVLYTATGNSVFFADNFENLSQMMSYDALLLQLRNQSDTLSATETNNLQAFIASGRRVLMVGENVNWTGWNQQILAVVGGTDVSSGFTFPAPIKLLDNELTNGTDSLILSYPGESSGGTSLYDYRFAMLWGTNQNALTILDGNVFEDGYWTIYNSAPFATNVADWLAGSQPVPEPATMLLFGLGLAGVAGIRRLR